MGGRFHMLDRHWFLVVIHLKEKKCYLLDSLNTTTKRKNLALKLTEEMRVERLKYLVKLLKSEFNDRDHPSNSVKDIVKVE